MFSENRDKEFQLKLKRFFNLVKLGIISPAAYFLNWVPIGRSRTMAATICKLPKQMVLKIFNLLAQEKDVHRWYEKQILKPICGATIPAALDWYFVG